MVVEEKNGNVEVPRSFEKQKKRKHSSSKKQGRRRKAGTENWLQNSRLCGTKGIRRGYKEKRHTTTVLMDVWEHKDEGAQQR